MLKAAIIFFVLGVLSMIFGLLGLGGLSDDFGETILWVFFIFALMSFIGSVKIEKKNFHELKTIFIAVLTTTFLIGVYTNNIAYADENATTTKGKVKEIANDGARATKKTGRKIEDKTCEMINGKMKCAAKKVKHEIQNAADNVRDAAD